jgi:hypothetical protein
MHLGRDVVLLAKVALLVLAPRLTVYLVAGSLFVRPYLWPVMAMSRVSDCRIGRLVEVNLRA